MYTAGASLPSHFFAYEDVSIIDINTWTPGPLQQCTAGLTCVNILISKKLTLQKCACILNWVSLLQKMQNVVGSILGAGRHFCRTTTVSSVKRTART